jgi:RNA-dependent RNA polymerase
VLYSKGTAESEQQPQPAAWLTHRFSLDISLRQYKLLWMCMVRLRKLGLKPDFRNPHLPLDIAEPIAKLGHPRNLIRRYSFQVQYGLECLLSTNTVSFDLGSLLDRLDATRDEDKRIRMLELIDLTRGRGIHEKLQGTVISFPFNLPFAYISLALDRLHLPRVRPVPSHCFYIRRCLVTPLRLVLLPPQLETSNSILRAFSVYRDRFMRVHFAAEEGSLDVNSVLLQVDDDVDGEVGLFARVRRALRYGLDVAGRHYQFLTFGESQIK